MTKKVYREFNREIKPDENHAQLLIKLDTVSNSLEVAKKIVEDSEIQILKTVHISSDWVLFKLNVKDIRNVSLKMTEHGFLNFKGINALPPKLNER